MKVNLSANIFTAFSCLLLACIAGGAVTAVPVLGADAVEKVVKETRAEEFAEARQVFERYKRLDLTGDAKLIELYSPAATIEAGVERERGDIRWQKLDRDGMAKEIVAAFNDEHLSALKNEESFGHPKFKKTERAGKPAVEVIFHGSSGHAGIKVTWFVQQDSDGRWLIVSEKSVTYNKRKAQPQ